MKNNFLKNTLILVLAISLASFTTISEKNVDITKSQVAWKAYKVTGSHAGTLALKSGNLNFESDKLVGGEFIIDMMTLAITDIQGEYAEKLKGHLKSDDFFGVATHPTANIIFKTHPKI